MSDITITIVGTGAIGTSLGLALKQMGDPPRLVGHDKDFGVSKLAQKKGAFDKIEWNLINACDQAEAIILALPASEIEDTLKAIAADLKEQAVVTDTASTKKTVVALAEAILPTHAHFIGGHPIVNLPGQGPENAQADLFEKSVYCLTPSPKAHPEAVKFLQDMTTIIGATPLFLDPDEHDGLSYGVNLLPQLMGLALIRGTSKQPSWAEMRRLAGPLFAQVSLGASGSPEAMTAALLERPENTLRWLNTMIDELQTFKRLVQDQGSAALTEAIDQAIEARQLWWYDFEQKNLRELQHDHPTTPIEKPSLFGNLFGSWAGRGRT